MNRFFTLLLAASCLTAVGQVTYPYNPDGNADTLIGVTDLQDLLVVYGNPFLPQEVLVDGEPLSDVLGDLQTQIESMQLALGTTEYYEWYDLDWQLTPPSNNPWESVARFSPGSDGFLTINYNCAGGYGITVGVIPDSIEYADRDFLEAQFEQSSFTSGQLYFNYSQTIALNSSESVVFSASVDQLESSGICLDPPTLWWTPIIPMQESAITSQEEAIILDYNVDSTVFISGNVGHIVINPPLRLEHWRIRGTSPVSSNYDEYFHVDSLIEAIEEFGFSNIQYIEPAYNSMTIDLSGVTNEGVLIEWSEPVSFADLLLPTLQNFQALIPQFDWYCDNAVGRYPNALVEGAYRTVGNVQLLGENRDWNTQEGLSGNAYWAVQEDRHIGFFQPTYSGFWAFVWGGLGN